MPAWKSVRQSVEPPGSRGDFLNNQQKFSIIFPLLRLVPANGLAYNRLADYHTICLFRGCQ